MTDLGARYGIARETGYIWLRRYRERGVSGLVELNRSATRYANQTALEIEQAVLELRQAHMRWGPRKLKRVLERDQPGRAWPAASTMGALLKREGLVIARKKRRKTAPYSEPLAHADGPKRAWCADFKGWFRTANGQRIEPLTISDAPSRYLLRCQAVEKTDTERVRAIFEAAFMHRTLKQEVAMPAAQDRREQQRALERFRQEYNQVRPHEALGRQTPASVYTASPREYPRQVPEPEYPPTMLVRPGTAKVIFAGRSGRQCL